jgi:hypothetical protein
VDEVGRGVEGAGVVGPVEEGVDDVGLERPPSMGEPEWSGGK